MSEHLLKPSPNIAKRLAGIAMLAVPLAAVAPPVGDALFYAVTFGEVNDMPMTNGVLDLLGGDLV